MLLILFFGGFKNENKESKKANAETQGEKSSKDFSVGYADRFWRLSAKQL